MVVVLSEPLLPSRPNISPRFTEKDKSFMTILSAKAILKWLTSIMFSEFERVILVLFYHF